MSDTEVDYIDDLEAGELSVEFEGQEPWDLLEWAIDRFGSGLAVSTAFQEGDVALIDMAYRIDPEIRVFSIDTGRLPQETHDLVEQLRERYDGLRLEFLSPDAARCSASSIATGRTSSSARSRTASSAATSARCSRSPACSPGSTPG